MHAWQKYDSVKKKKTTAIISNNSSSSSLGMNRSSSSIAATTALLPKPAIVIRASSTPITTTTSSSAKKTATEVNALAGRMSSILSTDTLEVLQKKSRSNSDYSSSSKDDSRVRSRGINKKRGSSSGDRPRSRSNNNKSITRDSINHNNRTTAKKSVSQSTTRSHPRKSCSPVRVRKCKTTSETRGDIVDIDVDAGVALINTALDVDIDLEEDDPVVESQEEDHSPKHAAATGPKVRQTRSNNNTGRRSRRGHGGTRRQAGSSIRAEQMARMASGDHAQFREEDIVPVSSDDDDDDDDDYSGQYDNDDNTMEEHPEEGETINNGEAAFAPAKLVLGAVGSAAATANNAASLAWTTGAATAAGVARTAGATTLQVATKTVGTTASVARTAGATTLTVASNTVGATATVALSAGTTTLNAMGRGATAATTSLGYSSGSHNNDGGHARKSEERRMESEVSHDGIKKGCNKNSSGLVHTLAVVCLCLLTTVPTALASVPPKLGSAVNVESIHEYRQRMNLQPLQYKPRLVSIDMCRDLSDVDCEKHDVLLQEHAQKHQAIQKKHYEQRQRQRKLALLKDEASTSSGVGATSHLRSTPSQSDNFADFQHQLGAFTKAYGSGTHNEPTREEEMTELEDLLKQFNTTRDEHYRRRRQLQGSDRDTKIYNPSVGIFVVPLFLVKFTDHESRPVPDKYEYQILWNLRIRKWIDENSYGRYEAWFDVQDWEVTDNTEKHYAFGTAGRVSKFQNAFYPALDAMDERLGGDWSLYDADGDGVLDNVIMLHSGYAAEEAGNDCTNNRGSNDRIWSHAFSQAGQWASSNGSYTVRGYMVASSLDLLCDANPAKMGVMTHEYLHTMYLIDLYDTNFNGKGLGNYDIMAYPYGADNTGNTPVHLSVWAKEEIEWQQCTEITAAGEYTLPPAATTDACFKITLIDYTAWPEYFLLENRQQANFDINFFEPGLMMYHIDDAAEDQDRAGYPGLADNWPATGDHYRVAAVQADGAFDLEQGTNIGDKKDQWQPGQKIGPNTDGSTFPNTDSYQQGWVEATGITIEVLEHDGLDVKIKVDFGARSAFSTPMKEREEGSQQHVSAYANSNGASSLAEDQFIAGDTHHRISGKIPQLPWYEEWRAEQAASSGKQCLLPSNYLFVVLAGVLSFLFV